MTTGFNASNQPIFAPIPATGDSALAGYKIYYANTQAAVPTSIPIVVQGGATTTYDITGLTAGTRHYGVKAFNNLQTDSPITGFVSNTITTDTGSASVSVTVDTIPGAPTLFTVAQTAYNIVKKTNGFVMLPVGTIPLNTPCDPEQTVNGFNVVDRTLVTWSGSIQPEVVVAKCSNVS